MGASFSHNTCLQQYCADLQGDAKTARDQAKPPLDFPGCPQRYPQAPARHRNSSAEAPEGQQKLHQRFPATRKDLTLACPTLLRSCRREGSTCHMCKSLDNKPPVALAGCAKRKKSAVSDGYWAYFVTSRIPSGSRVVHLPPLRRFCDSHRANSGSQTHANPCQLEPVPCQPEPAARFLDVLKP